MSQTKIRLFGVHICYIRTDMLIIFQRKFGIVNFNSWLKEEIYNDYKLYINNPEDIEVFKEYLEEDFYDNIGDWLKEKMRNKLKEK